MVGSPFMEKNLRVEGGAHYTRLTYLEKEETLLEAGFVTRAHLSDIAAPRMTPRSISPRRPTVTPLNGSRSYESLLSAYSPRFEAGQTLHERGQMLSQTPRQWAKHQEARSGTRGDPPTLVLPPPTVLQSLSS